MGIIINLLINSFAVFIASHVLPGVTIDSFETALIVAILLGIVNAIIKPILLLLTLPLNLLTLGLFTFVINGLLILLVAHFVKGFHVNGLLWAIILSIVISIISSFLSHLVK